jgi:hypothetical protein
MNAKNYNTISAYQRAVLSELGIATWRLQNAKSLDTEEHRKHDESRTEIAKTVTSKKASPIPDAIKRFKTQPEPTPVRKSVPNSVVLGFNLASVPSALVNDVLLSIELPADEPEVISTANSAEYSDFLLAWDFDDKVAMNGRLLTTPSLNTGLTASNKKQLWALLSKLQRTDG